MTSATAADYGWISSSSSVLAYGMELGYSLTLVRGVSPSELFRIVGAEPQGVCEGLNELIHEQQEFLDEYDEWPDAFLAGAFTVQGEGGDWTLVLEFGGGLDMRADIMEAISAGTRAVSHSSNGGKPMDFFHWYEQGELRTTFEWPADRTGSTPNALNPLMLAVGLHPSGEEDPDVDRKAAVLALTERLTGVRVTQELLAEAEYHVAEVQEEPAEERESVTTVEEPAP
ncbi:DUF6461 domain-containing protein [Streptomyces sp. NBC_01214]|uniref:DUF6461 domain-containing protein n=1 Tax=Streptomyces sp. NBC_01214 TaxID=2903777 RepID=UPI002259C359|nr:DUF6461 domain-containing protein [Streptomyces sp. NBC_01214]MCX4804266.1 DUF6461 domain-containing protein [Streptomyces sp. NBC_01214]